MRNMIRTLIGVFAVAGLLALPQAAHALGTAAGTTISNTATLNYSIGGVTTTATPPAPATFTVDQKIDVNVSRLTANPQTVTVPNSTNNIHIFKVTNLGNGQTPADPYAYFTFTPITAGGQVLQQVDLYADNDFSGTVTAGDTPLTAGVALNIPADGYAHILMVGTATGPATLSGANGVTETYNLIATASDVNGNAVTASATPTAGVDVVFTDAAGVADIARDGKHSASGSYQAATAVISMTKDVYSIVDPYSTPAQRAANGGQGYAIPGATVTYLLTITNSGSASASLSSVTDTLAGSLAYVANSSAYEVRDAANVIVKGPTALVDGTDVNVVGQSLTFNISNFLAPNGTLPAGQKLLIYFDTTIQ